MNISRDYGPQFDPTDGTVGKVKLVKRWVIVCPDLEMAALKKQYPKDLADLDLSGPMGMSVWFGMNGYQTRGTKKEAEELIKAFYENNPPDRVPKGLKAVQAWCWPGGFDFAGFLPETGYKNIGAGI